MHGYPRAKDKIHTSVPYQTTSRIVALLACWPCLPGGVSCQPMQAVTLRDVARTSVALTFATLVKLPGPHVQCKAVACCMRMLTLHTLCNARNSTPAENTCLLWYTYVMHCMPADTTCPLAYFARWHCMPASTTSQQTIHATVIACSLASLHELEAITFLVSTGQLALHARLSLYKTW